MEPNDIYILLSIILFFAIAGNIPYPKKKD
jgi:hypothetical protein